MDPRLDLDVIVQQDHLVQRESLVHVELVDMLALKERLEQQDMVQLEHLDPRVNVASLEPQERTVIQVWLVLLELLV